MGKDKILCAVDFGTTYSGVAYAYVEDGADPDDVDVELIQDHWPGQTGASSPKVPTVLKFDKTAPNGFKWGFQLDDDPDRICFAKLYLDPSQMDMAEALATFSKRLGKLPPNKKVSDVVTRYLGALREVALDRMAADWGEDFVQNTPIQYILTVPAVWSDKAKSDTLSCASQAGFGGPGEIRLITEPEAAAVYTFKQLPDFMVKKGDVFITCDCGGGTVDLTTYKVAATEPYLRVDEMTVGGGGLCGSVYLNKRFEDVIRSLIGKQLDALPKSECLEAIDEIQKRFNDEIKPDFGVSDDDTKIYYVPVPAAVKAADGADIKDGKLAITAAVLKKDVFDPVIRMVLQHLIKQLERVEELSGSPDVSAILLVGGFGSSAYLRKEVEKHFDGDIMPQIKVLQPVNAWSAVTMGAMQRGLQGDIVQSRIIRASYGCDCEMPWNPEIHESPARRRESEKRKIYDELEGKYFCEKLMRWYVHKGEAFSNEKVVKFSFYRTRSTLNNLVFRTELLSYSGDGERPYFKNADSKVVGTLVSDLSKIPKDRFEVTNSGNGDYYKINYDLELRFEAAISFRLRFQGEIIGEINVDYSHR